MSQGPYRPTPPQTPMDPRLAALVEQGRVQQMQQMRGHEVDARLAQEAGVWQLRLALGAHRGKNPRRRTMVLVGLVIFVAAVVTVATVHVLGAPAMIVGFLVMIFGAYAQPRISEADLAMERERARAVPYRVNGLFEAMSTAATYVTFDIQFDGSRPAPDVSLIHAAFSAFDPRAEIIAASPGRIAVRTGPIHSFSRGFSVNRRPQYDHRSIGPRVMAWFEQVLPPIHASYGILQVDIRT